MYFNLIIIIIIIIIIIVIIIIIIIYSLFMLTKPYLLNVTYFAIVHGRLSTLEPLIIM